MARGKSLLQGWRLFIFQDAMRERACSLSYGKIRKPKLKWQDRKAKAKARSFRVKVNKPYDEDSDKYESKKKNIKDKEAVLAIQGRRACYPPIPPFHSARLGSACHIGSVCHIGCSLHNYCAFSYSSMEENHPKEKTSKITLRGKFER